MVFNARSTIVREEHKDDTFITPINAILPLVEHIQDDTKSQIVLFDGCCGYGSNYNRIGGVLREKIPNLIIKGTDLNEDGTRFYLNKKEPLIQRGSVEVSPEDIGLTSADWLVSNPPFNQKEVFMKHYLVEHINRKARVALLMPLTTLGGKKYGELYEKFGYPSLLLFKGRVQFIEGKSSNVDVGWFIWDNKEHNWLDSVDLKEI